MEGLEAGRWAGADRNFGQLTVEKSLASADCTLAGSKKKYRSYCV